MIGLLTHMGLGDHILCNGMVRYLASVFPLTLFVKREYFDSVKFMFRDMTNVSFIEVQNDQDAWMKQLPNTLKTGLFFSPNWHTTESWCKSFYTNLGLEFSIMYSHFFIQRDFDRENKLYDKLVNHIGTDKYIVVHDDPRFENIDIQSDIPVVKVCRGRFPFHVDVIFDYCKILENAVEFHGYDSSFAWIIELLKLRPIETTFLHRTVRKRNDPLNEEFKRFVVKEK